MCVMGLKREQQPSQTTHPCLVFPLGPAAHAPASGEGAVWRAWVRFRCQASREQETKPIWRGCMRSRPPHLSRQRLGDPFWWKRSRASLWLGFEFHFQPLLGGSLGSLQTFDNGAKYTLESEEVWAARCPSL